MPLVPFGFETTSHGTIIDMHVEDAAVKAFGPPCHFKLQQHYLSAETGEAIRQRSRVLCEQHFTGSRIGLAMGSCGVLGDAWFRFQALLLVARWLLELGQGTTLSDLQLVAAGICSVRGRGGGE